MYSKVISHAMMGPSRPEVVRGDVVGGGPRGRGGMAWGVGGRRFLFGLGWASGLGLGWAHTTRKRLPVGLCESCWFGSAEERGAVDLSCRSDAAGYRLIFLQPSLQPVDEIDGG